MGMWPKLGIQKQCGLLLTLDQNLWFLLKFGLHAHMESVSNNQGCVGSNLDHRYHVTSTFDISDISHLWPKICSSLSLQFWFAANSKSGKMLVCGQFRVYRGVPENFVGFLYIYVCVLLLSLLFIN